MVCATSKASDQPAHMRSLIRAFASLLDPMIVKLLTEHHSEFLSLTGGCRGSSESTLVKMPNCWKSHVTTQMTNFMVSLLMMEEKLDILCESKFMLIVHLLWVIWYTGLEKHFQCKIVNIFSPQGTKIFKQCTCLAGRVTYHFHSSGKHMHLSFVCLFVCLFDLILYVHSTIFQLCGTGLPWLNQY